MSRASWRCALLALGLAVSSAEGFAQEVQAPIPHPESQTTDQPGLTIPASLSTSLPSCPAGIEALDRLLATTLLPLPGVQAFDWFLDAPLTPSPAPGCNPCPQLLEPAPSFGGSLCCRPNLFGDWGGLRPRLAERGLNFNVFSTSFFSDVANGGLQETFQHRGRMDYLLNIDGEKAGLWRGLFIDLHGETVYGNTINQYTGTIMPVSMAQLLPVPNGYVTALTQVKFTQFLSEQFLVYGGKLNLADAFNQPFTGGALGVNGFWNTAMLINPVLLRTVPLSTFGFGAAYLKGLEPVVSFAVLDANNTPTVSGFDTFFQDGVVLVPQINIPTRFLGLPGHQGLIATWSSKRYLNIDRGAFFNVLQGAPVSTLSRDGAWSLAYMFDQALVVSQSDPRRMWGVFGNLGIADTNPSPVRWFGNFGVGGSALRGRPLDTFGLGYYYLGLNTSFKQLAPRLLPLRDEHGFEAFYNFAVTPWCRITPDVQFILPAQERAQHLWFFGLRAKLDF